ncbi:helix-turn-helix transcriptional regulator [Paractinoplanes atraurantiacus]|uniref:Predicted DNA-binding transcriptional regulator YafY, contains an HTH and WYL domains n=1 Tax=Paractinoplanes atraurantiacus TaxID=1036182 RepID=A0A285HPR4_9ACTN|nr:WYL domain-containing protein [Actinoplanes atraurantiacus]SNY37687.1 Predicted DNA-binding transcriptional regulator YafY, contains an HTH and WYL domains [Actinoplanes atraurantiacus]
MPTTSARLLALLSLLQSRRDWPGTLLADRLDVSLRTVRRDVDRLRELGYPIAAIKGPDGGYRLGAGTQLPPLLFDDEQAVALTIALQVAATRSATAAASASLAEPSTDSLAEAAARALTTIRQVLPARLRHRVDALRVTAVERPTARPAAPVDPGLLLAISAAVHATEVLRFDYGSGVRRAEPHHVVTWDGRWYLIAWDLDRHDWRTFRADRITLRTPNGPRFTPRELPGGDVATYVTGKFRGGTSGNWPCQGTVILDLPAATVALYTRDGLVEEAGPDRCRLTTGSWSWPALAAAIARFDADVEVIGPPELTSAFTHLAERFARITARSAA